MTERSVHSIEFELDSLFIKFTFTYSDLKTTGVAYLQLPHTSDSEHSINGLDDSEWDESHQELFEQLQEYYFNSFKDVECAAASAALGLPIIHVEPIEDVFVAFNQQQGYVLEESNYKSYYAKAALFDVVDRAACAHDCASLIKDAQSNWFSSLAESLTLTMGHCLAHNLYQETHSPTHQHINKYFDEVLNGFMAKEFGVFWANQKGSLAQTFYESWGCTIKYEHIHKATEQVRCDS